MCCIFTCCGWMIDLIQRAWIFTMSCCISSSICCVLLTSSMSGIALGYNYSLAEYVELKETNVSVYLKRGVFDDEIADDMDWRRSGHLPVAGHIKEDNLMTGASEEDQSKPLGSGRRLDDSIFESDDQNKFEGSLMRLTAKAIDASSTTEITHDAQMDQMVSQYPVGSLDQLKAIQSLINMRKSAAARHTGPREKQTTTGEIDERYLPRFPIVPNSRESGRRGMPDYGPDAHRIPNNPLRLAVPDQSIKAPSNWALPKLPPELIRITPDVANGEFEIKITYPSPVTPRAGPIRLTRPKASSKLKQTLTPAFKEDTLPRAEIGIPKSMAEELDTFKEKLLLDKFDEPSFNEDSLKKNKEGSNDANADYYDDEAKGLPVRRKRNIRLFSKMNVLSTSARNTKGASSSENVIKNIFAMLLSVSRDKPIKSADNVIKNTDANIPVFSAETEKSHDSKSLKLPSIAHKFRISIAK